MDDARFFGPQNANKGLGPLFVEEEKAWQGLAEGVNVLGHVDRYTFSTGNDL